MPTIHTDVLSIDFPPRFTSVEQIGQGTLGQYPTDDSLVVLDIYPVDRELLHKTETGQTERYRTFCGKIYGTLTWLEEKTLALGNDSALLMTAEGVYGFAYLFAFIRLTDTVCLFAGGYCPLEQQQEHFITIETALRSLRIVTATPETAYHSHLQAKGAEAATTQGNDVKAKQKSIAETPAYPPITLDPALLPLLAENSPTRQHLVDALLSAKAIAPIAHAVAGTLRSSVDFYHGAEDDHTELGNHRLGGLPDLPDDVPYPCVGVAKDTLLEYEACWQAGDDEKDVCIFPWDETTQTYRVPLEFIAQVDCGALALLQDYLPHEGTLFFFLECGSSPLTTRGKVIYVQNTASLSSGTRFAELAFNDEKTLGQKPAFKLHPRASVTVPSFYALRQNPHIGSILCSRLNLEQQAALDDDAYDDALSRLGFAQYYAWQLRQLGELNLLPGSKTTEEQLAWMTENDMLPSGFPSETPLPEYQGIARVNGCGFSQHELPELQAAQKLGGDAQDWLVLFQVCLDGQFQWDDGILNFIIHRTDLAAQRFDRIFMVCDY
ncbi:YwqG family protein [Pectobacterium araliae]